MAGSPFSVYVRSLKPKLIESIKLLNKKAEVQNKGKVWIEAYGCSASIADSEMIAGMLKHAGYEIASSRKEGSLNLIVTCSVKDTTEHKMVHRIKQLGKTGKPLVVAGCLPKADRAKVESLSPQASLMGPHSIDSAAEVVGSALAGSRLVMLADSSQDKVNLPRMRINPVVGIVEIASGCMSECTFCQTKNAKGWLHSYRIGDIVKQVRQDVAEGCKEVWLTSTDSGCYGRDMGSDLAELLRSCCEVEGDFKIRVGMMNPQYMPEMLGRLAGAFEHEKMFRFAHMPVQSGSNAILRKMKRGHTARVFADAVKALRAGRPDFTHQRMRAGRGQHLSLQRPAGDRVGEMEARRHRGRQGQVRASAPAGAQHCKKAQCCMEGLGGRRCDRRSSSSRQARAGQELCVQIRHHFRPAGRCQAGLKIKNAGLRFFQLFAQSPRDPSIAQNC
jgi:hypothetical protein